MSYYYSNPHDYGHYTAHYGNRHETQDYHGSRYEYNYHNSYRSDYYSREASAPFSYGYYDAYPRQYRYQEDYYRRATEYSGSECRTSMPMSPPAAKPQRPRFESNVLQRNAPFYSRSRNLPKNSRREPNRFYPVREWHYQNAWPIFKKTQVSSASLPTAQPLNGVRFEENFATKAFPNGFRPFTRLEDSPVPSSPLSPFLVDDDAPYSPGQMTLQLSRWEIEEVASPDDFKGPEADKAKF